MRAVDYVDLGHYLRDVRESLNVTVEDAARALHIRPRYIADLEIGNLDNMPGKAYIRGYIKNYAEFLRLDPQEVLEEYEKLFGAHAPKFFVPKTGVHNNMPSASVLWYCFFGLIGLYGFWYVALYESPATENMASLPSADTVPDAAVKVSDAWDKCFKSDEMPCFFALHESAEIPAENSSLIPEVKAPASADTDKPAGKPDDKDDDGDD